MLIVISARVEINEVRLYAFPKTFNLDIFDGSSFSIHREFKV